jgi:hypothetical protein
MIETCASKEQEKKKDDKKKDEHKNGFKKIWKFWTDTNFNWVDNIFQHSSTKVFCNSPKEEYAAYYVVCKFRLRGPFRAAHGKHGVVFF